MVIKIIAFFCVFVIVALAAVEIYDFLPFGRMNGDTYLPSGDDTSSPGISISTNFNFFNHSYSKLWVNVNGAISFNQSIRTFIPKCAPVDGDYRMISPFWYV